MKVQCKWGEVTILMEKPGKHCLSQVMKVNIIGDVMSVVWTLYIM